MAKTWSRKLVLALLFSISLEISWALLSSEQFEAVQASVQRARDQNGKFDTIESAFLAVRSLKILGLSLSNTQPVCSQAQESLSNLMDDLETGFHAVSVATALNCPLTLRKEHRQLLENVLTDLRESSLEQKQLAVAIMSELKAHDKKFSKLKADITQVVSYVVSLQDEEGTFYSHADAAEEGELPSQSNAVLAYSILSNILSFDVEQEERNEIEVAAQRLEVILAQAEVLPDDSIVLVDDDSGEPDAALTAHLLDSAVRLGNALGLDLLPEEECNGFLRYFLQKATAIANFKTSYHSILGLQALNVNQFHKPILLTLKQTALKMSSKDNVEVSVTDVFGNFVTKANVFITEAKSTVEGSLPIISNQQLHPVSKAKDNTAYSFNFLATKPDAGFYEFSFAVSPLKNREQYFFVSNTAYMLKVTAHIVIGDFKISVSESPDAARMYPMNYGEKLSQPLSGNVLQHLRIQFGVKTKSGGKQVKVAQAAVMVTNKASGHSAVFLCDEAKLYHFSKNFKDIGESFGFISGTYSIHVLAADSYTLNQVFWEVAEIVLNFPAAAARPVEDKQEATLPTIAHQFKRAEPQPPVTVSSLFTLAVAVPALILLVGLFVVGANLRAFPSGTMAVFALFFQISLAAVLALLVFFWLRLKLIPTLYGLVILSAPTVFFGRKTLTHLANQRAEKAKQE